jgi:signal transduction histidine kinase
MDGRTDEAPPRHEREQQHRLLKRQFEELQARYRELADHRAPLSRMGDWLLHHAAEGVAFLEHGAVGLANRRFFKLIPPGRRWVCVSDPGFVTGPSLAESLARLVSPRSEQDARPRTLLFRSGEPTLCFLEVQLRPFDDGSDRWVAVARDATEMELLRQREEEAGLRDRFLAMLAHELRNPLTAIVGASEIILRSQDPHRIRRAAETVLAQARHEARLVEDLLDTARVRQGKIALRRERTDLRELLQEAAAATEEHRRVNGVTFELRVPHEPAWVYADRSRVVQCAVNLLTNAAKFTPEGGRNCLELETAGDTAVIRVTDTGVGIEPEMLPHVFDVFSQSDASLDRSQGGLGLGLALVKSLAELHGGQVRASSRGPGAGAAFEIRIPAMPDGAIEEEIPQSPVSPAARAAPVERGRCVLLVEDNAATRETLAELLEDEGYRVLPAGDGRSALELAAKEQPEVILTDIGLPGMDGFTLARWIRAALPGARLVAMSGYSRAEDLEHARDAGFDGYVVKPVEFPALLDQIRRAA